MVLVTGGTGFVGQEIVTELLALGHRVRLLVRHPDRASHLAHDSRVELAVGDALRPETLPAAMQGVHIVIHLIGIIKETSRVTFQQGHVEATRNVLAAAQKAGVTRWIQMTAIGTRAHAASRYHQTKWEAEELVRRSGLDWTIFRPSLIYGYDHRDRILNLFKRFFSWPLDFLQAYSFPLLDGGHNHIQPVFVREVARCFALAPANVASIGQTYDLVGPEAMSWRGMLTRIAAARGKAILVEDKVPLFLILRIMLWFSVGLLPILATTGYFLGKVTLDQTLILLGFWGALLVLAQRWTCTLFFPLPTAPLLLLAQAGNLVLPRSLQFSEQLKMAVEDNMGDSQPAARDFHYQPEPFETALARILQP